MAIRSSGPISFSDLRTEAGTTGAISLGDGQIRDIIGALTTISIGNAYSKTRDFTVNISALSTRSFITTLAYDAGWQGTGNLTAVIPQGTVVSTLVTGQNPWGSISLFNSGFIMGKGGDGGFGNNGQLNSTVFNFTTFGVGGGSAGADGLVVSTPSQNRVQRYNSVYNFGTIAGGGGGGGGGSSIAAGYVGDADTVGGGGGGGGRGIVGGAGGAGGVVTVINGAGTAVNGNPGGAGSQNSAGGGGSAGVMPRFGEWLAGAGGSGGGLGAPGAAGGNNNATPPWGFLGSGGAGGSGVLFSANINGTSSLGTVFGAIS